MFKRIRPSTDPCVNFIISVQKLKAVLIFYNFSFYNFCSKIKSCIDLYPLPAIG